MTNIAERYRRWSQTRADLNKHLDDCRECTVDRYCEDAVRLNEAHLRAQRAVTHPGEVTP